MEELRVRGAVLSETKHNEDGEYDAAGQNTDNFRSAFCARDLGINSPDMDGRYPTHSHPSSS